MFRTRNISILFIVLPLDNTIKGLANMVKLWATGCSCLDLSLKRFPATAPSCPSSSPESLRRPALSNPIESRQESDVAAAKREVHLCLEHTFLPGLAKCYVNRCDVWPHPSSHYRSAIVSGTVRTCMRMYVCQCFNLASGWTLAEVLDNTLSSQRKR